MLYLIHFLYPLQLPSCCRSGGAKCTRVWMAKSVKFFQISPAGPAALATKSKPPR